MKAYGQVYLLIGLIFIGLILAVVEVQTPGLTANEPRENFLMKNIKAEMPRAYVAGLYGNDLNASLSVAAQEFRALALGSATDLNLFLTAYDQNSRYLFINYSGGSCTYSSGTVSATTIGDRNAVWVSKASLLNDNNITFCGHAFDLNEYFQVRVTLKRGNEVSRWENRGKPS